MDDSVLERADTGLGLMGEGRIVLDLVSQVRDVVLMNVYLDQGNLGGLGFWNGGI